MSDKEGRSQPRATSCSKCINIGGPQSRFPKGPFDKGTQDEDMITGGNFWNDSPVGTVQAGLGGDERAGRAGQPG